MPSLFSGLDKLPQQLAAFWSGLSGAQRFAFLSIVLITGGAVSLLVNVASKPEFATLYAELSPEDSASIIDELATAQVPFKLTHAGTSIQVPLERVYDLRLELAANGLPASGPVGFEVFDDNGLGMTPFQQRVRFRRALEGELSRTISRLSPVNSARVHITLPEKAVFKRDQAKPRAAVVVSLAPGRTLSGAESNGIAHLISGAVDGLEANQITILDSSGRLLARPGGDDADLMAAEALGVQRGIEKELSDRAQALLDAALGGGKSVVTVTASINTQRFEETKDRVNPEEAAVLSEQRVEESRSEPVASVGGIPGTPSNVPGGPGAEEEATATPATENVTRETINFEISRSSSRTIVPMGQIQKLSVAVLVDGVYEVPEVVEAEEAPSPVYQPRSEEEIQQISEIVKRAVGFDTDRGDVIEVQNFAFRSPLDDLPSESVPFWEKPELYMLLPSIGRVLSLLVGLILLSILVLRPALRQLAAVPIAGGGGATGPFFERNMTPEQQALDIKKAELAIPLDKSQAKDVAEAIRGWLRE
jgi:flagellar M-ring protein FliF